MDPRTLPKPVVLPVVLPYSLCFRSSSKSARSLLHASSGGPHRLSCLYASSVSSLLDDVHPSESMGRRTYCTTRSKLLRGRVPTTGTEEGRETGRPVCGRTSAPDGGLGSRREDGVSRRRWISLRCTKSPARRVMQISLHMPCEWAQRSKLQRCVSSNVIGLFIDEPASRLQSIQTKNRAPGVMPRTPAAARRVPWMA